MRRDSLHEDLGLAANRASWSVSTVPWGRSVLLRDVAIGLAVLEGATIA